MQLVRDYEVDNFGLVATDLTNTYEVENMMNIVRDFHKYDRMFDHHTSDVEAYEKYLEHLRKDYYENTETTMTTRKSQKEARSNLI